MRLCFLGSPPFGTPVLEALFASRHQVAAVITPPDRASGRGRSLRTSPLAELAEAKGAPLVRPETTKDDAFLEALRSFEPDVLVVASYGEILRQNVLDLAPHGALNVHGSLLPRWRGAAPIQRAILEGDAESGVSIQKMVLALDEGDVILERRTPIGDTETAGQLFDRLALLGGEAIVAALDELEAGTATFSPQDEAQVTYAPKLKKADGALDWSQSAAQLARQVRAFSPWPGTRTSLPDGKVLGVTEVEVIEGEGAPGTVIQGLDVATGDGALRLLRVKPAGKGEMDAAAFLNGARIEPGTVLGTDLG